MKICVTANGVGLDAQVDPRFGRCQYFTFVDSDTMQFDSVENASIAASGGAGIQSAQFVANEGADVVLTGNVGPNAYNTLQAAGVKIFTNASGTVKEAMDAYLSGELHSPTSGPSVTVHSGMSKNVSGSGMGRGTGMGRGKGMGRGMVGTESPPSSLPSADSHVSSKTSKDDELQVLKEQSQELRSRLDEVMQRINKFESSENPTVERKATGISQVKKILKDK